MPLPSNGKQHEGKSLYQIAYTVLLEGI